MVRDTSLEAYNDMVASGRHAMCKAVILKHLIDVYPQALTRLEINQAVGFNINVTTSKVNELINKDFLLVEDGKRECSITGRKVYQVKAIMSEQRSLF